LSNKFRMQIVHLCCCLWVDWFNNCRHYLYEVLKIRLGETYAVCKNAVYCCKWGFCKQA